MKRKKIEKEKKSTLRLYAPVIKACIVLVILIALLVGVILFKPVKKEEIKDPSILPTNEKNVNLNDAKCDGKKATTIKEDVAKVAIQYEVVDDYFFGYMAESDDDLNGNGIIDEDPVVENIGYALKLKLRGLTDNIYVVITNDLDDNVKTFHKADADKDNIITWYEGDTILVRTYTVKIYSANEGCTSELYREFTTSLPKFNILSRSLDCEYEPAKSIDLCQPFIFSDRPLREETIEFKKAITEINRKKQQEANKENEEENKEEEKTTKDKIISYVKDNYIIVSAVAAGVVIIIIAVVVAKRKKGR